MLTLILLLQISLQSLTPSDADMEVEWPEILNTAIEDQLREGGVRVVKGDEVISRQKGERSLGVPRLVASEEGEDVLTLKLVQTYLPATLPAPLPASRTLFTVEEFNGLAVRQGFTYTLWETKCDASQGSCLITDLARDFLREYGEMPEVTPTDDDEWALTCDSAHSLCRDSVIKVGYENRNRIALPRTAHCEGHDS